MTPWSVPTPNTNAPELVVLCTQVLWTLFRHERPELNKTNHCQTEAVFRTAALTTALKSTAVPRSPHSSGPEANHRPAWPARATRQLPVHTALDQRGRGLSPVPRRHNRRRRDRREGGVGKEGAGVSGRDPKAINSFAGTAFVWQSKCQLITNVRSPSTVQEWTRVVVVVCGYRGGSFSVFVMDKWWCCVHGINGARCVQSQNISISQTGHFAASDSWMEQINKNPFAWYADIYQTNQHQQKSLFWYLDICNRNKGPLFGTLCLSLEGLRLKKKKKSSNT